MKWISHIAIAGSIAAVFNPAAVPVAVLGSTAPDWLERVIKATGTHIKHRAATHYLVGLGGRSGVLPGRVGLAWVAVLVQLRRPAACAL